MGTLEKRLHLMIDQARYDRLAAEAERSGRSVADIVRSAIDLHFDEERDQARRAAAGRRLLSYPPDPGPAESWEDMLAIQEAELDRKLELS